MLTRRQLLYVSTFSLVGIGIGVGYAETKTIGVTRLNLGIGSKIAFLADPHIHEFGWIEERVIRLVRDEEPDIVMLGGDIVDEYTGDMKVVARYIAGFESREKYAVLGNHDYWSGKASQLVEILKANGFDLLNDSTAFSSVGKVYGLDWKEDRRYTPLNAQGIVLVHDPNSVSAVSGRCSILSGHTHGGLVVANLVLHSNSIYVRGLYNLESDRILYVSRGVGQILPIRPTSPLELVIIE